jgi:hypothetical protein
VTNSRSSTGPALPRAPGFPADVRPCARWRGGWGGFCVSLAVFRAWWTEPFGLPAAVFRAWWTEPFGLPAAVFRAWWTEPFGLPAASTPFRRDLV